MSVETQTFRAQRIDLRERRQRLDLACRNTLDVLRARLNPSLPVVEICEDQAVDDMLGSRNRCGNCGIWTPDQNPQRTA